MKTMRLQSGCRCRIGWRRGRAVGHRAPTAALQDAILNAGQIARANLAVVLTAVEAIAAPAAISANSKTHQAAALERGHGTIKKFSMALYAPPPCPTECAVNFTKASPHASHTGAHYEQVEGHRRRFHKTNAAH